MLGIIPNRPRVWIEGESLLVRSSLLRQLLSLFSYCRRISISRTNKQVTIRTRFLWILTHKKIVPFDNIRKLIYTCDSWIFWKDPDDDNLEMEWFEVGLSLYGGDEVPLFTFWGYGTLFLSNADASLDMVTQLEEFTGKKLVDTADSAQRVVLKKAVD